MGWMRQRVPSHRSASVPEGLERVLENPPTAVQTRRERHATDDRKLISALTGFGVGSTFHVRVAISLDPPASDAPAMESAVKPSKMVNDPSRRVARHRESARGAPLSCRLPASVWLRLGTAPRFYKRQPTNILARKAASLRLIVRSPIVLSARGTASVPATDRVSVVCTQANQQRGGRVGAARLPTARRPLHAAKADASKASGCLRTV